MIRNYTIDMFCADQDEMAPLMKLTRDVEVPEDEWPKISIEGTVYGVNPNVADARVMRFFTSKYGRGKGSDYGMRFLSIMWFIDRNRGHLVQEGLICEDDNGHLEICEELLQVLLESFTPPKPPVIFPTSSLAKKFPEFDLERVVNTAKLLLKD